ncbi:MAG: UDP-N-acetylenolpyruvoylglucosamine reductase [Planctomycetota bacterium]|nr:MAG: UDP-N-acetylenolpyruvoylglucosamine reductase [Planctomycetota bacterium]
MNIFKGLESIVKRDCPLTDYTWFGLGGKTEYLITPTTVNELQSVIQRCNENDLHIRVLGFGSNLLVSDKGVSGAVIKLQGDQFSKTKFGDDCVTVGAGAGLNKVVLDCVRKGLSGLEALTGIPGSVGGAVRMNAGGNFGDIGTSVESVTLMGADGKIFEKSKPELVFDYRWTNITAKFVLGANIKLVESDKEQMLRTLKEVWIYKKNSQPLNIRNAGCVFKNPRGLSAGALIDRTGLKGLQIGGAQVSEKHANFIIAHKGCTSNDVQRLIEAVRERVKDKFNVELELEIEIW